MVVVGTSDIMTLMVGTGTITVGLDAMEGVGGEGLLLLLLQLPLPQYPPTAATTAMSIMTSTIMAIQNDR